MAKIFYQEDCNLSLLEGKTIAIIGYGSQGHAHALNAKESGCHVIIGLYEGSKSWAKAEAQGFEVYTAAEAAKKAYYERQDLDKNKVCPSCGQPIKPGEHLEQHKAELDKTIQDLVGKQNSLYQEFWNFGI